MTVSMHRTPSSELVGGIATPSSEFKIVIYARISRDRNGLEAGVERQIAACKAMAQREGWVVVEVIVDNDLSAYNGAKRPGYERLLDVIASGEIEMVLVWHQDRLSRNNRITDDYVELTRSMAVRTYCIEGGELRVEDPTGRYMIRQGGNNAQYFSELTAQRLKLMKSHKAAKGEFSGGPRRFGFEVDGVTVREAEAAEIRKACQDLLNGLSLASIAKDWNHRGVPTPRGGKGWNVNRVRDLLERPRNCGQLIHLGEIRGPAQWEAIVSVETWQEVQAVIRSRADAFTYPRGGVKFFGTGIYRCGGCGTSTMCIGTSNKWGHKYMCYEARRPGSKNGHVARLAEPLDQYVESVLVERLSARGELTRLLEATSSRNEIDVKSLVDEQVEIRRRKERLATLLVEGLIDEAQLRAGTAEANHRLGEIQSSLDAVSGHSPLVNLLDLPDIPTAWFGKQRDRSDGLPLDIRRAVARAVVTVTVLPVTNGGARRVGESYFDPSRIEIAWKG